MDLNQSRDSPGGFMYTGPSRSAMGEDGDKGGNVERGEENLKIELEIFVYELRNKEQGEYRQWKIAKSSTIQDR